MKAWTRSTFKYNSAQGNNNNPPKMQAFVILASAAVCIGVAMASYDPYSNLAQLYRYQLLADAFGDYNPENMPMEDTSDIDIRSYWPELADTLDVRDPKSVDDAANDDDLYADAQLYSHAHIRDPEHIEHSSLHGYQSVSGGTAEGPVNNKIQKSDKPLPAYCNPPNPCPVGKTAKDNCVENFENSADNNKKLLSEQDCPCDTEHMFSCPAGKDTVSSKGQSGYQQTLNKVIDQLSKINDGEEGDSIVEQAVRSISQVAKKSPHVIHKRSENEPNPYMAGAIKNIASKKSIQDSQSSMKDLLDKWLAQHQGY